MLAIKGMDMPKSCADCPTCCKSFTKLSFKERTDVLNNNIKLDDCPIIELPEENNDMSWEALKEHLKIYELNTYENFILKIGNACIHFSSDKLQLFTFHKNGNIITDDMYIVFKNAKYYFMCQTIKALIESAIER